MHRPGFSTCHKIQPDSNTQGDRVGTEGQECVFNLQEEHI